MLVVPFTNDPAQSFSTRLGGEGYTFEARYNDRAGYWTFDLIRNADDVTLVAGAPILLGQDLLAPYALEIGGLVATDLSAQNLDAGPEDLGERVIVTYLTPEELAVLAAAGAPL